jgi:hypothetical protein
MSFINVRESVDMGRMARFASSTQSDMKGITMAKLVLRFRFPVRDDVQTLTYHRKPTAAELRFGYGAIHYRDFPVSECCHALTRIPKKWLVAPDDGLRYYR